jgi:transcriptional regulator with XRE-family HTH domain
MAYCSHCQVKLHRSEGKMDAPKERLKILRNMMGLTQKELAERLNLSWYQLKDLESGRVKISPSLAKLIFYETGFNIEWLLEGKGKMKSDLLDSDSRVLAKVIEKTGIEVDEKEKEFLLNIIKKVFSEAEFKAEDKVIDMMKIMRK